MDALSDVDVAALLRLAGEVGELAPDIQPRRAHILNGLLELVGGSLAACSEVDRVRDDGVGWSLPNSITAAGADLPEMKIRLDAYLTGKLAALDPCIPLLLRSEKPVITARRADVIGDSWFRSDHFNQIRRPARLTDSLYSILTAPDDRCIKVSIHRYSTDPEFTARDMHLLHIFNQNLASLYFDAPPAPQSDSGDLTTTTSRPLDDPRLATLPPRVRPVLQLLLAGDSEKQAAQKLGLSPHTVHAYTKLLYRTFEVNSRGEMLARFIASR
jgi:DNA-binding CsgD family transcriptional regulator